MCECRYKTIFIFIFLTVFLPQFELRSTRDAHRIKSRSQKESTPIQNTPQGMTTIATIRNQNKTNETQDVTTELIVRNTTRFYEKKHKQITKAPLPVSTIQSKSFPKRKTTPSSIQIRSQVLNQFKNQNKTSSYRSTGMKSLNGTSKIRNQNVSASVPTSIRSTKFRNTTTLLTPLSNRNISDRSDSKNLQSKTAFSIRRTKEPTNIKSDQNTTSLTLQSSAYDIIFSKNDQNVSSLSNNSRSRSENSHFRNLPSKTPLSIRNTTKPKHMKNYQNTTSLSNKSRSENSHLKNLKSLQKRSPLSVPNTTESNHIKNYQNTTPLSRQTSTEDITFDKNDRNMSSLSSQSRSENSDFRNLQNTTILSNQSSNETFLLKNYQNTTSIPTLLSNGNTSDSSYSKNLRSTTVLSIQSSSESTNIKNDQNTTPFSLQNSNEHIIFNKSDQNISSLSNQSRSENSDFKNRQKRSLLSIGNTTESNHIKNYQNTTPLSRQTTEDITFNKNDRNMSSLSSQSRSENSDFKNLQNTTSISNPSSNETVLLKNYQNTTSIPTLLSNGNTSDSNYSKNLQNTTSSSNENSNEAVLLKNYQNTTSSPTLLSNGNTSDSSYSKNLQNITSSSNQSSNETVLLKNYQNTTSSPTLLSNGNTSDSNYSKNLQNTTSSSNQSSNETVLLKNYQNTTSSPTLLSNGNTSDSNYSKNLQNTTSSSNQSSNKTVLLKNYQNTTSSPTILSNGNTHDSSYSKNLQNTTSSSNQSSNETVLLKNYQNTTSSPTLLSNGNTSDSIYSKNLQSTTALSIESTTESTNIKNDQNTTPFSLQNSTEDKIFNKNDISSLSNQSRIENSDFKNLPTTTSLSIQSSSTEAVFLKNYHNTTSLLIRSTTEKISIKKIQNITPFSNKSATENNYSKNYAKPIISPLLSNRSTNEEFNQNIISTSIRSIGKSDNLKTQNQSLITSSFIQSTPSSIRNTSESYRVKTTDDTEYIPVLISRAPILFRNNYENNYLTTTPSSTTILREATLSVPLSTVTLYSIENIGEKITSVIGSNLSVSENKNSSIQNKIQITARRTYPNTTLSSNRSTLTSPTKISLLSNGRFTYITKPIVKDRIKCQNTSLSARSTLTTKKNAPLRNMTVSNVAKNYLQSVTTAPLSLPSSDQTIEIPIKKETETMMTSESFYRPFYTEPKPNGKFTLEDMFKLRQKLNAIIPKLHAPTTRNPLLPILDLTYSDTIDLKEPRYRVDNINNLYALWLAMRDINTNPFNTMFSKEIIEFHKRFPFKYLIPPGFSNDIPVPNIAERADIVARLQEFQKYTNKKPLTVDSTSFVAFAPIFSMTRVGETTTTEDVPDAEFDDLEDFSMEEELATNTKARLTNSTIRRVRSADARQIKPKSKIEIQTTTSNSFSKMNPHLTCETRSTLSRTQENTSHRLDSTTLIVTSTVKPESNIEPSITPEIQANQKNKTKLIVTSTVKPESKIEIQTTTANAVSKMNLHLTSSETEPTTSRIQELQQSQENASRSLDPTTLIVTSTDKPESEIVTSITPEIQANQNNKTKLESNQVKNIAIESAKLIVTSTVQPESKIEIQTINLNNLSNNTMMLKPLNLIVNQNETKLVNNVLNVSKEVSLNNFTVNSTSTAKPDKEMESTVENGQLTMAENVKFNLTSSVSTPNENIFSIVKPEKMVSVPKVMDFNITSNISTPNTNDSVATEQPFNNQSIYMNFSQDQTTEPTRLEMTTIPPLLIEII
ncbi:uncharacterized protein LOC123303038 [Chrysoperla carnea]|uniref:uncharacterized protein LOC123303038 n=1 Tax=Chrysoperla carnea TaxID=189513 RepID=UPI001D083FF7|nr:uncharacterized protein LOC123303038 [Chrysoperla carnea]